MEPAAAAKGVAPEIIGEEIVATTEEIVAEAKEVIEAPSRLREKFRRLEDLWGRAAVQFYQAPKL